jgi:SAM-dependent methyltransferase
VDGYEAASYGDTFADVYDDWYADVSDVEATVAALAQLAGDGSVLELGIGSGRLALPLAARGVRVWGIDASTLMIERLRAKPGGDAIPVALGDMADVDLSALPDAPSRFAVVLVAFNTIFNLTDEAAQRRCLRRSREVLAPGGRLVIEAHVPDEGARKDGIELRTMSSEHIVLIVTRSADDPAVLVGEHLEIDARGVQRRPWVIRMCGPAALDAMAADAGLRLAARWSSWHGDPYGDGDPVHVSLYDAR